MAKLRYSRDELIESHTFARPHEAAATGCTAGWIPRAPMSRPG
ncbi:hypothetical protein [Phenylobacterium sp. J367]|nr:hypothetical protein [Phenylobacterium sp. J367]